MLRKSVTSFGHQRRQSDQRYMIMHLPSYLRRADDVNTRRPIFFVVWADGMRYFATRYSIVVLLTHIYTTTCVGEDVQFFRLPFWRLGRYEPWCRESSTVVCEEERKREPGREIERVKRAAGGRRVVIPRSSGFPEWCSCHVGDFLLPPGVANHPPRVS